MTNSENEHLFSSQNVADLLDVWKKKNKPIVVWAGAGLSAPAKLPTWSGLRSKLVSEARNRESSIHGAALVDYKKKLTAVKNLDAWLAFERLEEILGHATFQAVIRAAMVESLRADVPRAYVSLWDLGIQGLITLNIDQFAGRAFHGSTARSLMLYARNGFQIKTLIGTLTDMQSRFIASLHGSSDEPDSWVFTEKKLKALLSDDDYGEFVGDCVKYGTIVLMGISAQDNAVLNHFKKVSCRFSNAGPHFWVADSSQAQAAALLENAGVRTIIYSNRDGSHSFLDQLLAKVRTYTPIMAEASPVIPHLTDQKEEPLPAPNELIRESPNRIRTLMNKRATAILVPEDSEAYAAFEAFCKDYARSIHSTTYFSQILEEDADRIGDYFVDDYFKEGGFAKVWRGHDRDGNPVAIKVFRHEVREQPDLLKAFRRGVRSMRHLAKKGVPGVVKFLDAAEIPPVVIMEWVEGATLYDAVKQGATKDWAQCLRIARDLAHACFDVHNTPERIVHRDLRPQNIMLRDWYTDPLDAQVVVLDFDLSWHLGAHEKSVYISGGTAYLAPEQLTEKSGVSTRSATVDSYGFGMTLYFMVTGVDPEFFSHARPNWRERIETGCLAKRCREWHSLPRRVARLIFNCTMGDQNRRMTFGQITSEIDRLFGALTDPADIRDTGYVAEEVVARVPAFTTYVGTETGDVEYRSPGGVRYRVRPNANERALDIQVAFTQAGHERYQSLSTLKDEFRGIVDKFSRKVGVLSSDLRTSQGDFQCDVTVRIDAGLRFIELTSGVLSDIASRLTNTLAG